MLSVDRWSLIVVCCLLVVVRGSFALCALPLCVVCCSLFVGCCVVVCCVVVCGVCFAVCCVLIAVCRLPFAV